MMNRFICCVSILLLFAVSSCASINTRKNNSGLSDGQLELVSRDFVSAISKLRGYSPRETTIQFYPPNTLFEHKMHDAMRGAGFGIQVITKDETANNVLTYQSDKFESSTASTVAYEVSIGKVTLGREYEVRTGRVFPITALAIKGNTTSTTNRVNNDLFNVSGENDDYAVVLSNVTGNSSILFVDEDRKFDSANIRPRDADDAFTAITPKQNMAELGDSNYKSLFQTYKPVQKYTLVFADDSLKLGRANKKTIQGLAEQYNAETDVISVIGCSHGKTKIKNGNALLANGRASRVKEELIMANVNPERILDEGCWASEAFKSMPPRGVLLTLRSKSNRG